MQERIDQQLRKQPGLDPTGFNSLRRQLEYADLRELEDLIVSKGASALLQDWQFVARRRAVPNQR